MGRAMVDQLRQMGRPAIGLEPSAERPVIVKPVDVVILSLRSGAEGCRILDTGQLPSGVHVVDLTTQEAGHCTEAGQICSQRGFAYSAGGVLGGVKQISEGRAVFLVGPKPSLAVIDILKSLGSIILLPTPIAACQAKLLHNLVLLLNNHAIALCMRLASEVGLDSIEKILDCGTAGRRPSQSSVARDCRDGPSSSYTSALVVKDVRAIIRSFPELRLAKMFDLDQIAVLHQDGGDRPYTAQALQILGGDDESTSISEV
jgi:3-hydroxyisobutyrate dehydrogenase-like beta-hydroxyacid dehydrogenase